MLPTLKAGVTLDFTTTVPGYPASAGWTLTFYLVRPGTLITFAAAAEGDAYRVQQDAVQTGAWAPGVYTWEARVSNLAGVEHEVGAGEVEVRPNIAAQTSGADLRSQARKAYDDALAARATYAAGGNAAVAEYQIGDRRIKFKNPAELEAMIAQLAIECAREARAQALAKGLPDPRKVYVRAGRV